jgi:hypothetical protein
MRDQHLHGVTYSPTSEQPCATALHRHQARRAVWALHVATPQIPPASKTSQGQLRVWNSHGKAQTLTATSSVTVKATAICTSIVQMLSKGIQGAAQPNPQTSSVTRRRKTPDARALQAVSTARRETLEAYGLHLLLCFSMVSRTFWTLSLLFPFPFLLTPNSIGQRLRRAASLAF